MNSKPLVSAIIPIYNTEDFLETCVNSVLKQTYDNVEIILVDDGSPDSCPEICDRLASENENITVIHKENGGSSEARNFGMKAAKGDFICFLDSDDYWDEEDALEYLVNIALSEDADVVTYGLKKVRASDGSFVFEKRYELDNIENLTSAELFEKMVRESKLNISACLKLMKRSFLIENDLFFKVGMKTEDLEWAIRFFACEPEISVYFHSFYVYRIGREGSNTSTMDYGHLKDFCDIIDSSIEIINNTDKSIQKPLMSYLMYQTVILVALTGKIKMTKAQRNEINSYLSDVCKKYLKSNTMDKKVQLANKIYRLFGYGVMQKVLCLYLNHRGR